MMIHGKLFRRVSLTIEKRNAGIIQLLPTSAKYMYCQREMVAFIRMSVQDMPRGNKKNMRTANI